MHIQHKPGDKLMVDWAGTALPLYDKISWDSSKVYLFVATLPFSAGMPYHERGGLDQCAYRYV